MKNVLCRRSLLLALAFGISLVGFGSVADAGVFHFRRGCRPVYRYVPCRTVQYAPPAYVPSATQKPNFPSATQKPNSPSATQKPTPLPSGVLLEVVDLVDPLEVGTVGTYLITVTNQGSILAITKIEITATLPEQLEYMSSEGPTEASAEGQVIRFAPLETLYAGEEVVYRLKAKAVGVGDIRFQLELTTDQSSKPILETESTFLYE